MKQKQELSVFSLIFWTVIVPNIIVTVYQMTASAMGPDEEQMARSAGVIVTLGIALYLIATGQYKLVLRYSKNRKAGKPVEIPKGAVPKITIPKKTVKPSRPKEKIVTDPATGAQTLYEWNEKTGRYETETSFLDEDRMDEWERQRISDKQWNDKQFENVSKRNTAFDRDIDADREKAKKELAEMDRNQKIAQENLRKYGEYTTDKEVVKEKIRKNQDTETARRQAYEKIGNNAAVFENTGLATVWLADFGMDICDILTLGAGKPIKYIYIAARNTAGDLSDAIAYKKDIKVQLVKSVIKTGVDLTQARVNKIGYKYAANGIGDGIKGGMEAYEKGEDVVSASLWGTVKGLAKTGIEHGISNAPKFSVSKKPLEAAKDKSLKLLSMQESGALSEKTATGMRNLIRQQAATEAKVIDGQAKDLLSTGLTRLVDFF